MIKENPFQINECSVVAYIKREQLTSEELKRLQAAEVLEIAPKAGRAHILSRLNLPKGDKIYSVKILQEMLAHTDEANDKVGFRLKQLLRQVDVFDYFWLF